MADVKMGREQSFRDDAISGVTLQEWEKKYYSVLDRIVKRVNDEFKCGAYHYYSEGVDFGAGGDRLAIRQRVLLFGFIPWTRKHIVASFDDMRLKVECTVYMPSLIPIFKEELSRHADDMGIATVVINTEF